MKNYIEFYRHERIHLALDYLTRAEYYQLGTLRKVA
ncbi:hypothetical protein [Syntrophothermus lipocalidus]